MIFSKIHGADPETGNEAGSDPVRTRCKGSLYLPRPYVYLSGKSRDLLCQLSQRHSCRTSGPDSLQGCTGVAAASTNGVEWVTRSGILICNAETCHFQNGERMPGIKQRDNRAIHFNQLVVP